MCCLVHWLAALLDVLDDLLELGVGEGAEGDVDAEELAQHLQVIRKSAEPREGLVGRRKESERRLAGVDVVAEEVGGLEGRDEPPETELHETKAST